MKNNIIDYFEETVKKYANRTAIVYENEKISFEELYEKVKIFQYNIKKLTNKVNRPIAVYLPKLPETVELNLAIAYSNNVFMNLDINTPLYRIQGTLDNVQPELVLTNRKFYDRLKQVNNYKVVCIEDFEERNIENSTESVLDSLIDTDPFCIINTSGSTGVPKSVVINYRSFIDFMEWADETFEFNENTIMGSLSPCVFDIYVFELWVLCYKGSTLVILEPTLAMFPIRLLERLNKEKVNYIFWVPTVMVNVANGDLLSKCNVESLKLVWFAGEVFPTKQFKYWKRQLPNTTFVNMYGPIEITLDCTYYIVNKNLDDNEPIPIGYPCHNTDILILNDDDCLCQGEEEGELCVRGTSLAMGYYNNPEKTQLSFVQNPLNSFYPELIYRTGDIVYRKESGEIIIKGRKDNLIKHMGYRIDLGEIEHILINDLKMVKNCCVVYNKGKKEITLYYEAIDEINVRDFRKNLLEVIPKYMLPTKYIYLDKLPMNTNGKIDRQKLKELAEGE